ncbi:MAG: hypothetical protein WC028_30180, partial [Candidatus Obscuribacterales bacterium]
MTANLNLFSFTSNYEFANRIQAVTRQALLPLFCHGRLPGYLVHDRKRNGECRSSFPIFCTFL